VKDAGWIMVCALSMVASVSHAASFAARPTLAQAEKWVNKAAHTLLVLDERRVATSDHQWPQGRRTRSGSISNLVSFLKQDAVSLASQYLDQSKAPSGNYNEWFKQNPSLPLPQYNRNSLIIHAGVPSDVEGKTPGTVIANLGPASSTHGLDACAAMIAKLTWLPVRQIAQTNMVYTAREDRSYSRSVQKYDIGKVDTTTFKTTCSVDVYRETLVGGDAVVPSCKLPAEPVVQENEHDGPAEWRIQGTSSYGRNETWFREDGFCQPGGQERQWNLSHFLVESASQEYQKTTSKKSRAYTQAKPSVKGDFDVYVTLEFSVRSGETNYSTSMVNCYDVTTNRYIVPPWNPAWPVTAVKAGSGSISQFGRSSTVWLTPPVNITLPETIIETERGRRFCDGSGGGAGIGQQCTGSTGLDTASESCSLIIPAAHASMRASHALVKVQPRYMP